KLRTPGTRAERSGPDGMPAKDTEIAEDDAHDRGNWTPPRRGRRSRRAGTVLSRSVVALTALALAATGAAVTFGFKWSQLSDAAAQQVTVRRVTSTFLTQLTTFKPTTVDADFQALLTFATGDFAKQANQFFGSNIRQQLEQAQAESEGQIRNLYVQSMSAGKAEVYAVVDQTYTNDTIAKAGGQPVADVLRVVLDLAEASGNWKISEVSVLQAPGAAGTPSATVPGAKP
ncbi:MAG TPA: hypothetical protein VKX24_05955, partial [Acidimicrobiia bacterium]|nr:hypothetical protein [Acidimicrobiia bacterium]